MIRLAFFAAGLILLIYLILQLGPHNVVSAIFNLKWNLISVTLIYTGSEMIRGVALWKSLPEGESQPYLKMLGIRLSGEAVRYLTFTGPFVGEPLKAWLPLRAASDPRRRDPRIPNISAFQISPRPEASCGQ